MGLSIRFHRGEQQYWILWIKLYGRVFNESFRWLAQYSQVHINESAIRLRHRTLRSRRPCCVWSSAVWVWYRQNARVVAYLTGSHSSHGHDTQGFIVMNSTLVRGLNISAQCNMHSMSVWVKLTFTCGLCREIPGCQTVVQDGIPGFERKVAPTHLCFTNLMLSPIAGITVNRA